MVKGVPQKDATPYQDQPWRDCCSGHELAWREAATCGVSDEWITGISLCDGLHALPVIAVIDTGEEQCCILGGGVVYFIKRTIGSPWCVRTSRHVIQ
jgi:hypothetical protein